MRISFKPVRKIALYVIVAAAMVLVTAGILVQWWSLGYRAGVYEMRIEAIQRDKAEWAADKNGEAHFNWKD